MAFHRPEAIANAFLSKQGALGRLTQMQIQKLVYIAHGWMLGLANIPLTSVEPQAWERGPVFPTLREHLKLSGARPINSLIYENDNNPFTKIVSEDRGNVILANFSDYEQQVIDHVWSRYGHMDAFSLSDLTHLPNTPWSQTYRGGMGRNASIPNNLIQQHYQALAARAA